jgi:hypothetical protein
MKSGWLKRRDGHRVWGRQWSSSCASQRLDEVFRSSAGQRQGHMPHGLCPGGMLPLKPGTWTSGLHGRRCEKWRRDLTDLTGSSDVYGMKCDQIRDPVRLRRQRSTKRATSLHVYTHTHTHATHIHAVTWVRNRKNLAALWRRVQRAALRKRSPGCRKG